MPRDRRVLIFFLLLLPGICVGAQHRRKPTARPKPVVVAPAPKPSTLLACGVSLKVPPGWELSAAKPALPTDTASTEPAVTPASESSPADTPAADSPSTPPTTVPPCSFVLAPKSPSALVRNTVTEGPIGQMSLRVVDGDLDTAAANLLQKDERGWFLQDSKGTRSDAKLTKQGTMQVLSSVLVQRCYDRSGKARGLCEVSKYVYSNGKRNLLVTAGPYIGETEYVVLNSVRFAGASAPSKKRAKR